MDIFEVLKGLGLFGVLEGFGEGKDINFSPLLLNKVDLFFQNLLTLF